MVPYRTCPLPLIGAVLVALVLATGTSAHADRCLGAKLKAIGKKESALLGCQSKVAASNSTSGLSACEMKVKFKFSTPSAGLAHASATR